MAPRVKTPIIFVHGIAGAWLKDRYPVDYAVRFPSPLPWDIEALQLLPTDQTVEASPLHWSTAGQAIDIAYESFVEELRQECTPRTYVFTYDWRKDNRIAATRLATMIDEVLHRARAYEENEADKPTQVILIGHSLGGLVIKWCVQQTPGVAEKVASIYTIATPFGGSLKAAEMLIAGARRFFGHDLNSGMRHAARTMPGVFQLLPAYDGALTEAGSGCKLDIFGSNTWQLNVRETLAQPPYPQTYLEDTLAKAKAFSVAMHEPFTANLQRNFYSVVGIGTSTWANVEVGPEPAREFLFNGAEEGDGDGIVATTSAMIEPPPDERIFYDEPTPFDYREWLLGHHANITNHELVQAWVVRSITQSKFKDSAFVSPQ